MDDRYKTVVFRGQKFYMDTVAFSPLPVDFCTGRVVEKGLEFISNSPKKKLTVLDFCSGQGCVGLSLFEEASDRIERVDYVDVNYFNLIALEKTLMELRPYDEVTLARHNAVLSNGLQCLPEDHKYDLILCNPPHRDVGDGHHMTGDFSLRNLFLVDPGWALHKRFYATVHTHLKADGECWFIELAGSPQAQFEQMIEENTHLKYLGHYAQEKLADEVPSYYWMGCSLDITTR